MINTETVFIIGAGAGIPYGYKSGEGLRNVICSSFVQQYSHLLSSTSLPTDEREDMLQAADEFSKKFECSSIESIDHFLAINFKEYGDIGKQAIVFNILMWERNSRFRERSYKKEQDWYSLLYNKMISNFTTPESYKYFGENKITFVTFNYDRSLEHFLYASLKNSFSGAPLKGIQEQMTMLNFHHVYGRVANAPWKNGLQYLRDRDQSLPDYKLIIELKNNIRVIHERTCDDELQKINEAIARAKRVYFLGFGFAKENIELLDIKNTLSSSQQIYGTAFDLEDRQISDIRQQLNSYFDPMLKMPGISPYIENADCRKLLRKYPLL